MRSVVMVAMSATRPAAVTGNDLTDVMSEGVRVQLRRRAGHLRTPCAHGLEHVLILVMDYGLVLFTSDRGIAPAAAAKLADDHGFTTFYVPEHTHIPIKREAAHPTTGDESLPDDRYMRTLDPWVVAGRRGRGHVAGAAVDRGGAARRARLHHAGQVHRHPRPPVRRPGQPRRRIRLEHRRTRRPQRAAGPSPHHAARVPRGDARAVDAGGSRVRRRVREVRPSLGVAQAGAVAHPGAGRRGGHREELQVDRQVGRRLDHHAARLRHRRAGEAAAGHLGRRRTATAHRRSSRSTSSPTPTSWPAGPNSASPRCCSGCRTSPSPTSPPTSSGWRASSPRWSDHCALAAPAPHRIPRWSSSRLRRRLGSTRARAGTRGTRHARTVLARHVQWTRMASPIAHNAMTAPAHGHQCSTDHVQRVDAPGDRTHLRRVRRHHSGLEVREQRRDRVADAAATADFAVERIEVGENLHYAGDDWLSLVFTHSNHVILEPARRPNCATAARRHRRRRGQCDQRRAGPDLTCRHASVARLIPSSSTSR